MPDTFSGKQKENWVHFLTKLQTVFGMAHVTKDSQKIMYLVSKLGGEALEYYRHFVTKHTTYTQIIEKLTAYYDHPDDETIYWADFKQRTMTDTETVKAFEK